MPFEHITVLAGGGSSIADVGDLATVYEQWETVVIEHDISVGYVNAVLTTSEVTPVGASTGSAFDKWAFPPGTPIEIYANGDFVCSTVVWQYAPSADAEQHSITIYCKSRAYDFDVSSIIDPRGGFYEDMTVYQIIQQWAQGHGIQVQNFGADALIPYWQIRLGGTGYEESLRMIKPHGFLLFGMMDGGIAISDGRALGAQGPVVQGENILRMSAKLTDEWADSVLEGQQNIGTQLKEALQPNATIGSALGRRKARLILEPTLIDLDRAMTRASWEARRMAGAILQATITVPGWHSPAGENYVPQNTPVGTGTGGTGGPLWLLSADTYVYAPWLKINCTLRTSKVVFKQTLAEGSTTELTLVDQATMAMMGGEPAKCESGSVWGTGLERIGNAIGGLPPILGNLFD